MDLGVGFVEAGFQVGEEFRLAAAVDFPEFAPAAVDDDPFGAAMAVIAQAQIIDKTRLEIEAPGKFSRSKDDRPWRAVPLDVIDNGLIGTGKGLFADAVKGSAGL